MFIYEIYISSFCDSNNDGIGDIDGIISKLGYLKKIGVDTIWITPFYPSPLVDNGYDVSDYTNVDSRFGNLEKIKELTTMSHKLGMKVIIDVVFNHSSDKHQWFRKSELRQEPYTDYYYWFEEPQNDWESFFGGSCFTYSETRKQYYLHRFAKEQPDLNLSNSLVIDELIKVLNFWIEVGIDGFRFDVLNFWICNPERIQVNKQDGVDVRIDDPTLKEAFKYIKNNLKKEIICVGEIGSEEIEVLNSYVNKDLMDMVFNFNIGSIKELDLEKLVSELKNSKKPTMLFSSHDMMRMHTRLSNGNKVISRLLFELMINYGENYVVFQGDEMLIDDFIPVNIDQVSDIQAVNKYNEFIIKNISPEEAFENVRGDIRDYSRKLLTWDTEVDESFVKIVNERKKCKITDTGIVKSVELIDDVIAFTKVLENREKDFIINFSDIIKKINFNKKEYVVAPYGVIKGEYDEK